MDDYLHRNEFQYDVSYSFFLEIILIHASRMESYALFRAIHKKHINLFRAKLRNRLIDFLWIARNGLPDFMRFFQNKGSYFYVSVGSYETLKKSFF